MKPTRDGLRMLQHEQISGTPHEDSYRADAKFPDPALCPTCGAVYRKGRWTWAKAPARAASHECPACRRIADDFPAGYVTLRGRFLAQHGDEVMRVVKAREAHARADHALQRIMRIEPTADGVLVTTTDAHLARRIAAAVHEAFKGELDLSFSKSDNLLRATWTR